MSLLFEPITIGTLALRNRLMRSATAERMADPASGIPLPCQGALYRTLAEGGVGLIIAGHAYVDRRGKAHPEMASIAEDAAIPYWREAIRPAQEAGARLMLQINYAGASCDPAVTAESLSPSGIAPDGCPPSRPMTDAEVRAIVRAYGEAARRARAAGLDGVQIHGAHGYLVTQFLTPCTNRRDDAWGGDAERRRAFLTAVIAEVRRQVGPDYPVWIKLGVAGDEASGLTVEEGAAAAAECFRHGVACVEVSHGRGTPAAYAGREEASFLPMARAVRRAVGPEAPLALVNGFRTRETMERVLDEGVVQLISLCRPLIVEPDLPKRMQSGAADATRCVRCRRCWPEEIGMGIRCNNRQVQGRT